MRSMILLFLSCAMASSGPIMAFAQTTTPAYGGNHPYATGHKLASATKQAGHASSRRTLRREGLTRNPASCVKYGCIGNN